MANGDSLPRLFVLSCAIVLVSTAVTEAPKCRESEYTCTNGRCVSLNRYCNSVNDCGDSSDEPRYCTPCNRTYFGDVGRTYNMELHRPSSGGLPFICHLTFKAGGGDLGDIIQITFDSFTIGRFVSFTEDGCPDGALQISESGRPQVGGAWCGASWGAAVYYSETSSITASLRLLRLSKDQNGYNFDFRIEYKTLRREAALVRYGNSFKVLDLTTPVPSSSPSNKTHSKSLDRYKLFQLKYYPNSTNSTGKQSLSSKDLYSRISGLSREEKKLSNPRDRQSLTDSTFEQLSASAKDSSSSKDRKSSTGYSYGQVLTGSKNEQSSRSKDRISLSNSTKDPTNYKYGNVQITPNNDNQHEAITNIQNRQLNSNTTDETSDDEEYYLGDLIAGTYCSRIFSDCDKKKCRLQSPNFPGIYPRNLTCYYAIRQHDAPAGQRALIGVSQPDAALINVRSEGVLMETNIADTGAGLGNSEQEQGWRKLKVWKECDTVQDYVTVYDGYTTRDPVLLRFCGGGEPMPEAVVSGHELLVEFSTSPYGTLVRAPPPETASAPTPHALHGFQLDIQVYFVDQQSPTYVRSKRGGCEFWIRGTGRGVLTSPMHSLPPNTTCVYHLQGVDAAAAAPPPTALFRPGGAGRSDGSGSMSSSGSGSWSRRPMLPPPRYRVWFSVLKFHVASAVEPIQFVESEPCASHLNVWDGMVKMIQGCNELFCNDKDKSPKNYLAGITGYTRPASSGRSGGNNNTLLARYCKDRGARSCDHAMLHGAVGASGNVTRRRARVCAPSESFLSSGDSLTLELRLVESTVLRPVKFRALYEFVDLYQDGEPIGKNPCSRRFVSRGSSSGHQDVLPISSRRFQAPRDVFLYGRGGNSNLSCVYRFEAQQEERVKLSITRLLTGNRSCKTREDSDQGRLECFGDTVSASVKIFELPWGLNTAAPALRRDCLCGDDSGVIPFTFVSTARVVELRFELVGMDSMDDFTNLFFEGTWEFIRKPPCARNMKVSGASGIIKFRSPSRAPEEVNCENHPWLISPSKRKFLYVKVNGKILNPLKLFKLVNGTLVPIKQPPEWSRCNTKNRISVTTGSGIRTVVCPISDEDAGYDHVDAFSEGWSDMRSREDTIQMTDANKLPDDPPKTIAVDFVGRETGEYSVMWIELARRMTLLPHAHLIMSERELTQCAQYRCPELDACINASLWCDGISHCPSGHDERITHCSWLLQQPAEYLVTGCLVLIVLVVSTVTYLVRRRRRRRRSVLQQRLKSLSSSDTAIVDEKDVIC